MKKIKIADRLIGNGEPCFIIAEAGVNHNGDVKLAKKLIDAAREAGADAVKFQTWKTDEIVTPRVSKPTYQKTAAGKSQYEMLKKLELSDEDFVQLAEYAKSAEIIFLSTPEGEKCTDFIDGLNVPTFKVGSADLTNHPHLAYVARKSKPMILSTGMATLEEVREAVRVIKNAGNNEIILLHCTSNYPAELGDVNLRAMFTLKKEFELPVGYSDHTRGVGVSIAAACLGAAVLEKHFTLDKTLLGPDHKTSLEPRELAEMVQGIRLARGKRVDESGLKNKLQEIFKRIDIEETVIKNIEKILGAPVKKPTESEQEMIKLARKYLVANEKIPKGGIIEENMVGIKRCGGGLKPKYLYKVIGRQVKEDVNKDEAITLDKLV
jgi:N-acetylneuraminate synthase/N,N'-diacetyllegionaminate synthase